VASAAILAGGQARRFKGRDKSLLRVAGRSILDWQLEALHRLTNDILLVGARPLDDREGLRRISDRVPDSGPLGGLDAALEAARDDRLLVVACDMPGLTVAFLGDLLAAAQQLGCACLAPQTDSELHPLCAVYHRRSADAVEFAIQRKSFKMHDLLKSLGAVSWPVADASLLENVNTPLEWGTR